MMGQEQSSLRTGRRVGPKYHIGIDFGTTFMAVAWMNSTKSKLGDAQFIENWPSGGSRTASKIPTVISYQEKRGDHDGHTEYQPDDVGFEVSPGSQHVATCFKLLLDEKTKLTEFDDPAILGLGDRVKRLGKSAADITADYLSEIFSYIRAQFIKQSLESVLRDSPLDFCITIPATWSDKAKRDTIAAAKEAGIRNGFFGKKQDHEIRSISEPEAAAIAVLTEMNEHGKLSPGDAVAICDAGGGRIDIVVYYIEVIYPLRIRELVPGLGGKFGSTAIDRALLAWLSETFGDSFKNLDDAKICPGSVLMTEFEDRKYLFGTESRQKQRISEPAKKNKRKKGKPKNKGARARRKPRHKRRKRPSKKNARKPTII